MSKRVILYCRVSSDEQKNDRLSIEHQERALRNYCESHGYEIVGDPYHEDYSAKDFDMRRPEIKRVYEFCKRNTGRVDLVLFLRWDRYSRNVEFAFTYKRLFLDELGVEINAIEEPIDFTATDWPIWLSIRCGVAHTEDIKISRRTQEGIHEHLMRGEWCGRAPRGYRNIKANEETGTDHYIDIDPVTAPIIKKVFAQVAEGIEAPMSIKRRLLPQASKSSFFKMLRNCFYIGYIQVPAFENFPAREVKGKHKPLIDIETFNAVQDVMDGKRRKKPKMHKPNNPNLYLRKYLICPVCGHRVTGATSKGHGGHYDYYCCNHDHKHLLIRAEKANDAFVNFVSGLTPNKAITALYKAILNDARGKDKDVRKGEVNKLQAEIQKVKERVDKVNDLYFDGELSKPDRDEQLKRYNEKKQNLESRIKVIQTSEDTNLKEKVNYGLNLVENLDRYFSNASAETKIRLLGSIFDEEIEFDGKNYRTSNFNSVLGYIYENANELRGKTETDSPVIPGKSAWVAPRGIEPRFKV